MFRYTWLAALSLTCMVLCGCGGTASPAAKQQAPPSMKVDVTTVEQRDVPVYGEWVATLDGYVNANIQPQVNGYLIKQNYAEGSYVQKGDVLFEIDARPFQAVLDQSEGQLAQAKGQVGQAQAQLELTKINVNRDRPLAAARAIAQSQLDNEIQAQQQAEAVLKSAQANVQTQEANIESARLNLEFTKVRSLVSGVAGIATTQVGSLVSPTTVLTTVSQVNPIKVYLPISEQEYMALSGKLSSKQVDMLRKGNGVPLELILADGSKYPHQGKILFADRQVDSQTGTIRLVASFPNPGNVLRPGQYGRVRALTSQHRGALLVPQRAISQLQGRYQVAVVGPDNKVSIREVQVGDRIGSMWVVTSGLNAGETVITEGVSKVRDGSVVNPRREQTDSAAQSANQSDASR